MNPVDIASESNDFAKIMISYVSGFLLGQLAHQKQEIQFVRFTYP